MALFMTKQDVNDLLHFVALTAATHLGVPDAEWETTNKLVAAVRAKNEELAAVLEQFMSAYVDWFGFHEQIEAEGKSDNLNTAEHTKLMEIIELRDNKRSQFIAILKGHA